MFTAIDSFSSRVWISHQAAEEFFRNRKTVIASAKQVFDRAKSEINDLEKQIAEKINSLKSNRLLLKDDLTSLQNDFLSTISAAQSYVDVNERAHPDYLFSDPILDRIVGLFDGKVGHEPTAEELLVLIAEAKKRFIDKTPQVIRMSTRTVTKLTAISCFGGRYLIWPRKKVLQFL